MRLKRNAILIFPVIMCFANVLNAAEVFLYLSFVDEARVYRVKTDYELRKPVGYFFKAEKADNFYVDGFKDFRFLRLQDTNIAEVQNRSIKRQVFSGSVEQADFGNGSSQLQDQRESLVAGSLQKPVFRPVGAPYSAGLGKILDHTPSPDDFVPGEVKIYQGKPWSEIPNNSWYQSWDAFPDKGGRTTYLIYHDCWQTKKKEIVESFWRGEYPGKVLTTKLAEISEKQLVRAMVTGAMTLIPGHEKPEIIFNSQARYASCFVPSKANLRGQVVLYTWEDKKPGKLLATNEDFKIIEESLDEKKRFLFCANKRVIVFGSDIFNRWLEICGIAHNLVCDQAAFCQDFNGEGIKVAVYSADLKKIFFFYKSFSNEKEPEFIGEFKLEQNPDCMYLDTVGNLLFSSQGPDKIYESSDMDPGYGFETVLFENISQTGEFDEEKGMFTGVGLPSSLKGHIILSKGYRENVYVISSDLSSMQLIYSIDLHKNYYYREFTVNKPSVEIFNCSYADLLNYIKKPGNRISELKSGPPDFPDQYMAPEKALISFFQE
ncbi:MAG: hypothetical protein Kow0029_00270 [Candidatus Rifleibacteriota bacterium]